MNKNFDLMKVIGFIVIVLVTLMLGFYLLKISSDIWDGMVEGVDLSNEYRITLAYRSTLFFVGSVLSVFSYVKWIAPLDRGNDEKVIEAE